MGAGASKNGGEAANFCEFDKIQLAFTICTFTNFKFQFISFQTIAIFWEKAQLVPTLVLTDPKKPLFPGRPIGNIHRVWN